MDNCEIEFANCQLLKKELQYESKLKIRDIFAQNDFFKSMLIPGNTEYVREHLTQARQTSLQY